MGVCAVTCAGCTRSIPSRATGRPRWRATRTRSWASCSRAPRRRLPRSWRAPPPRNCSRCPGTARCSPGCSSLQRRRLIRPQTYPEQQQQQPQPPAMGGRHQQEAERERAARQPSSPGSEGGRQKQLWAQTMQVLLLDALLLHLVRCVPWVQQHAAFRGHMR